MCKTSLDYIQFSSNCHKVRLVSLSKCKSTEEVKFHSFERISGIFREGTSCPTFSLCRRQNIRAKQPVPVSEHSLTRPITICHQLLFCYYYFVFSWISWHIHLVCIFLWSEAYFSNFMNALISKNVFMIRSRRELHCHCFYGFVWCQHCPYHNVLFLQLPQYSCHMCKITIWTALIWSGFSL